MQNLCQEAAEQAVKWRQIEQRPMEKWHLGQQ
jgi:hypothetical protein